MYSEHITMVGDKVFTRIVPYNLPGLSLVEDKPREPECDPRDTAAEFRALLERPSAA